MTSGKCHAVQGACLCGSVRYEVSAPFGMMIHCHCSMCRKHHGGSFATLVTAPLVGFHWISGADNVASYDSSAKGKRFFCKTCGSVVPTLRKDLDLAICPAGNLQGELDIRPQAHWFVGSKAPWTRIADSLPQHEEFPEEFGATGVTRPADEAHAGVIAGRCLCGKVAYQLRGQALRMMNCHCTRCQRGRSSAHATNLFYRLEDFQFVRGESAVVTYKVPDAKFFAVAFCGHCGGAAPRISIERGAVVVPAGTLDSDPGMTPEAHIFVNYKASWFDIADELQTLDEGPPPLRK